MKLKLMAIIVVLLISVSGVYAELHDRGGGLIYDDVLDVTWLQDANYAGTSGYGDEGRMFWSEASAWVNSLEYGGYKDWRLPIVRPVNGSNFDYNESYNGSTDQGWNIGAPNGFYPNSTASEMSYMYYQ